MSDLPVWLSGNEAAAYLGVSWPVMHRILIDHDIPHIKVGPRGPYKINTATLDDHLNRIARLQVSV